MVVTAKKGKLDPSFQRHFDVSYKAAKQDMETDQQVGVNRSTI